MNNHSKNNHCNNCGKQGHKMNFCKLPITSYGMIVFKRTAENELRYLMVRRKDTFGYIDFLQGNYLIYNRDHLHTMFNEMTVSEREHIQQHGFSFLWKLLWGTVKWEDSEACKKFEWIKKDTINELIQECTTQWKEPEWEFPKGRRNFQEKDIDCALREFEEETGLSRKRLKVVENLIPLDELFLGSNHKAYKHKYFVAQMEEDEEEEEIFVNYQKSEISKVEWKSLNECLESIRPYHLEKKQLLCNVHKMLEKYSLLAEYRI